MSLCKECQNAGAYNICSVSCEQFTDKGIVISRLLVCPKFQQKTSKKTWREFLDGEYA